MNKLDKEDQFRYNEPITDEEVQAIVKRYGESTVGHDTRSTINDVAEALQVEPSVVTRMLQDIRTSESEKQLRERLDTLEQENADLKRRAEESNYSYDNFSRSMHWGESRWMRRRKRRLSAVAMGGIFAGLMVMGRLTSSAMAFMMISVLIGSILIFMLIRKQSENRG